MAQADGVTCELVYSAHELYFPVVPEVNVVRGVLWVHTRCNYENQVAFPDHLHDFNSTFNAALDTEAERFERKNRKSFRRTYCKSVLILVETHMCDGFISEHSF